MRQLSGSRPHGRGWAACRIIHRCRGAIGELAIRVGERNESHRCRGLSADDAARVSIAEFGEPTSVIAAFCSANPARAAARTLLLTGPSWVPAGPPSYLPGTRGRGPSRTGYVLVSAPQCSPQSGCSPLPRSRRATGQPDAALPSACVIVLTVDVSILGYIANTGLLITWPAPLAAALSIARMGFILHQGLPRLLARC